MSANLDRFQNAESKPAVIVGHCEACCHDIQEGYLRTCPCGEKIHDACVKICANGDCVQAGCFKCMTHLNADGKRICEECYNKITEARKKFIDNMSILLSNALGAFYYNYTGRQETDEATILEFITSGEPKIHVHIGREILE